ncbi:MAG: hypothetical protein EOP49_12800, partial [Sphingobacteriales bacterium]
TTVIDGPPGKVPNFYKKPNGIFFLEKTSAGILTTETFTRKRPDARFATQSGPMLVIEGRLHPALIPGSTDRTRRSGVGVCENGQVRFAISETDVNFHDFARLFRDHLSCPNALFLDGGRGAGIYSPAFDRDDISWHGGYGPMFGLVAESTVGVFEHTEGKDAVAVTAGGVVRFTFTNLLGTFWQPLEKRQR